MYRPFTLAQMIEHFMLQRIMNMFIVLKFEIYLKRDDFHIERFRYSWAQIFNVSRN